MTWNRADLAKKGFFYDEEIRSRSAAKAPYPPHVAALHASMLDFSCAVLGCKHDCDEAGNLRLESENIEWHSPHIDTGLKAAKRTQNEAVRLCDGGYAEKEWEAFFQTQFLKPLDDSTSVSKENSRRASRSNYYYDSFTAASDALWTEFSGKAYVHDASDLTTYEKEKCPKPDRALYLPMYKMDIGSPTIPRITDPEARQWHQAPNPTLVESFSWTVLKELFAYGLRPTPFRVFHNPPKEADLKCYPWLIIEHKKEDAAFSSKTTVCCQATNAAACAVQLNRNAAMFAVELAEQAHVSPIPTVTTVGSNVTVWIMHYLDDLCGPSSDYDLYEMDRIRCRQGYIMRAIWKGDMTKLDDIIQFRLILENTHTWAMRVFKPLMASYVEQWRFVYCQAGISVAGMALVRRQQMVDRCRNTIPLVQSYLDKHSGVELDDSSHSKVTPLLLGLLVQQIFASERQILADEMDRIITEKLKGLHLSATQIVSDTHTIRSKRTSLVADTQETCSQGSIIDCDDADDGDYVDKPTSYVQVAQACTTHSGSDNEFRRSTRSNALRAAMAQSPSPSSRHLLSADTPVRNKDDLSAVTPLSGSAALADSSASTPTGNTSTSPKSVSSTTKIITHTTKSMQTLEIKDPIKSVTETMSKQVLFTASEKWPAGKWFQSTGDSIQQKDLPSPTPTAKATPQGTLLPSKNPTSGSELVARAAKAMPKSFIFSPAASTSSTEERLFAKALEAPAFKFPTTESDKIALAEKMIRFWRSNTGISSQILEGHCKPVNSVVLSLDSKLVASASDDETVRLWHADTGNYIRTFKGHINGVNMVAFSPDSKFVASASKDKRIRLWNANTGKCEKILEGHSDWVRSVAFSHDSVLVASASDDTTVRLWHANTNERPQILEGHSGWVMSVVFSHDSALVASSSTDKTVKLWRVDTGECTRTLTDHSNWVDSVAFSPDSTLVAAASKGTIQLWNARTGVCTQELVGHSFWVNSVVFSPNSMLVASASDDKTVRLWHTNTGKCVQILEGHSDLVNSVAFSPDSTLVASASKDKTIRLWRADTADKTHTPEDHSD